MVAGLALAIGGLLLVIATHWGHSAISDRAPPQHPTQRGSRASGGPAGARRAGEQRGSTLPVRHTLAAVSAGPRAGVGCGNRPGASVSVVCLSPARRSVSRRRPHDSTYCA
jgi:hypothetical protein